MVGDTVPIDHRKRGRVVGTHDKKEQIVATEVLALQSGTSLQAQRGHPRCETPKLIADNVELLGRSITGEHLFVGLH